MVLRWFLVSNTIGSNGFPMDFGPKTITSNVFWSTKPLVAMVFQWFPMVANHWSDDGMVMIHRSGLLSTYRRIPRGAFTSPQVKPHRQGRSLSHGRQSPSGQDKG